MVCGGVDIFKISGGGFGRTFIGVRVSKIKTFWNDCTQKCNFEWKTPNRFDVLWPVFFFIKALCLEMVKSTRCFSFKINDFVSIGAMRIPILCVWAPKANGLRKGWYFQKNWKWFWQCVYRGARIKNHHCCEELRQKVQFWLKNTESFWCFLRCVFFIKTLRLKMVKSTRCFSFKMPYVISKYSFLSSRTSKNNESARCFQMRLNWFTWF